MAGTSRPADAGLGFYEGHGALAWRGDAGGKKSRFAELHAWLDGEPGADCPGDWLIGLVCDGFGCRPSEAREELETDPDRTALRILELRAYARIKAQVEAAKTAEERPTGPLADLVDEINVEQWRARRRAGG